MSSKTDAAVLYLTAMWTAALTGVTIADGPQVNSDPTADWLFVGFNGGSPDEFNEGATAQQSMLTFNRGKAEDGQITCAVVSVAGDTNIPATRARAYAFMATAEDAVRNDMTLGGLVMHAFVSDHRYSPVQTDNGAKVRIVFTVTYKGQL